MPQTKFQCSANLTANLTAKEVQSWLEWAGSKLLRLRLGHPGPKSYGNSWPDYPDEKTAYAYGTVKVRPPAVLATEIPIMDKILRFPSLVDDPKIRQILHKRALYDPISERYIWPYVRLARELHIDARLASRLFHAGIEKLVKRIPPEDAYAIRRFMAPPSGDS